MDLYKQCYAGHYDYAAAPIAVSAPVCDSVPVKQCSWWHCQQGLLEEQEEGGEAGDRSHGDVLHLLATHTADTTS